MMKKFPFRSVLLLVALLFGHAVMAQVTDYSVFDGKFNFYVANDLGRNGYYSQKPIAELMGDMAEKGVCPEFVVAAGDIHHFYGVESVDDPLWMTNYELVYSHPELMIRWFPILGNHEYRGNTQAVVDYSGKSRRWQMPGRYYTEVFGKDSMTLRIVWTDTTPLIERYRKNPDTYTDACRQDAEAQLAWIDSVLTVAREDWVIVVGHHPIYAQTPKIDAERIDMQARLLPILSRHKVDMYINGHIHNFQHLRMEDSDIDYVTNSSASLSREDVSAVEGTVFCSPKAGFSIVSVDRNELLLRMVDEEGNIIHTVSRRK